MVARYRLIDDEEMLRQPDQAFLIDDVCSAQSLVLTHGQSGHGKSFLALDAAFSVANGSDWYGHAVKEPGMAVYIAAEGQPGLRDRIRAWKLCHEMDGRSVGVRFILEAVDPLNAKDVEALRAQLRQLPEQPKLIVVDTWSACMGAGGGDENSTKDASQAVFAWRQIMSDTSATVWIIHHEGHKTRGRARGSSALKAAAETEIAVSQGPDGIVTVTNLKQRDGGLFENLHLRLQLVPLGNDRNSCVLVPTDEFGELQPDRLSARAQKLLAVLRENEELQSKEPGADSYGLTFSRWMALSGQSEATFDRGRSELLDAGYVEKSGVGKGALYRTTGKGRDHPHPHVALTETLTEGRPSLPPSPVTPRRGDGGGGDGKTTAEEADDGSTEVEPTRSATREDHHHAES